MIMDQHGATLFGLAIGLFCSANAFTSQYHPDSSLTIQRFLEWLEEEECEGIGATEIGYSQNNGLRGIFSKESFAPNEYVLAVPFVSCVKVYESIYDMDRQDDEASDVKKASLFLEQWKNSMHWRAYFDCLPTISSNFDPSPDFWDEETIRQLEVPKLVQDTLALKRETESSAELQFATWLVRSRAFSTFKLLPDANEKRIRTRTMLIPFMDFLNHGGNASNAEIQKIEAKNDDESFFALVATQPIEPGEQITITYGTGHETTLDLFTKYGFYVDDNPNDVHLDLENVSWSTSLEQDEELRKEAPKGELRDMLALRVHLKRIQRIQQQQHETDFNHKPPRAS